MRNTSFTMDLQTPENRRTLSSNYYYIENTQGNSRNSSLWDEDYFNADTEVEEGNENFQTQLKGINYLPQPAGGITPLPRNIPISPDEDSYPPRQPRTHQRPLTAILSFLPEKTRSRGNSHSPERALHIRSSNKEKSKREADEDFMATLTGDRGGIIKVEEKRGARFAGWFSGSSAPLAVGIPIDDDDDRSPTMLNSRDVSPARRRPTLQSSNSPTSSIPQYQTPAQQLSTSRIANFFSARPTPTQTIQLPTSTIQSDDLLTLDIQSALFPAGPQSPNDPFSPSAYKNLLQNAEGVLLKLQTAYKLRVSALYELSSEREAQADELEEAETRNRALKSQLHDMAQQREEQDRAMAELLMELASEKQARAQEKAAREQSIREVRESRQRMEREGKRASCCSGTHNEEDLGIDLGRQRTHKKGWRQSIGSTGGESESDVDSVFSRSMSPTASTAYSETSSTLTMDSSSSPEILQASFGRVLTLQNPVRPKIERQLSTYQKILTGKISQPEESGDMGCKNCMGQSSSVAWDTVGLLKAENEGLKERVGELEGAVEGALDFVAGLGL